MSENMGIPSHLTTPPRDLVQITSDPIIQDDIIKFVSDPTAGAITLFIGTTRNHFEGKKVVELKYEAYVSMAEKQLLKLCVTVREKWCICKMAVIHRIGTVPVGDASVVVAVSSEHRHDSLSAVSYTIDSIKSTATIWKKEVYEDGDEQWKENKECSWK